MLNYRTILWLDENDSLVRLAYEKVVGLKLAVKTETEGKMHKIIVSLNEVHEKGLRELCGKKILIRVGNPKLSEKLKLKVKHTFKRKKKK